MDFRRPFQVVTPTLDGDVLAVLARADAELSGRELHRLVGHSSEEGVRKAADRLVSQGIVSRRAAGRANLYRLNRDHVAAPWVEGLATLRKQVIDRLRSEIDGWSQHPTVALVFGSFARGQATPESDLDLLLVRPTACPADSPVWEAQVADIQRLATVWTGNDARVLEFGEEEIEGGAPEPVLQDAVEDGIEVFGSRRTLRRLLRAAA